MNCFEARNGFIPFWQKRLADKRQAQLLTHLHGCASCDRSFRIFALTAPVLYSAAEPDGNCASAQPSGQSTGRYDLQEAASIAGDWPVVRMLNRALPAFLMAGAAAIALYFAAPPQMTFEDAIAADNSNAEAASYPATDSFFGQELMAQGSTAPELADE
jgi:hypothetical protein